MFNGVSYGALPDDTLCDISVEYLSIVHMFLAYLCGIRRSITLCFSGCLCAAAMLWVSDIARVLKPPITPARCCI